MFDEGEGIVPVLDRIFHGVQSPCEIVVVYDDPSDTTLPYLEKYAESEPRTVPVLNTLRRGAGAGDPVRDRARAAPGRRS